MKQVIKQIDDALASLHLAEHTDCSVFNWPRIAKKSLQKARRRVVKIRALFDDEWIEKQLEASKLNVAQVSKGKRISRNYPEDYFQD